MTKQTFTFPEAEAALCAWEHILERFSDSPIDFPSSYWDKQRDAVGTPTLRQYAIEMGPKIAAAWRTLNDKFTDPFDWEFVPQLLSAIEDPLNATQVDFNKAAQSLL